MALRIKELLYEDQYTIAGAKKRLANDLRGGRVKTGTGEGVEGHASTSANDKSSAQRLSKAANARLASSEGIKTAEDRNALRKLASELRELLSMLEQENQASTKPSKK
jgi:hypothetical protein